MKKQIRIIIIVRLGHRLYFVVLLLSTSIDIAVCIFPICFKKYLQKIKNIA